MTLVADVMFMSIGERKISRSEIVRRNPEVVSSINSPRPLYDLDLR